MGQCRLLPGLAALSVVPRLADVVYTMRTPPSAREGEVVFSLKVTWGERDLVLPAFAAVQLDQIPHCA